MVKKPGKACVPLLLALYGQFFNSWLLSRQASQSTTSSDDLAHTDCANYRSPGAKSGQKRLIHDPQHAHRSEGDSW
jgi:hypothetical protein